jgi:hypothetical protein
MVKTKVSQKDTPRQEDSLDEKEFEALLEKMSKMKYTLKQSLKKPQ